jgi:predicted GIY-YIG superfamily endonuclease
MTEDVLALSPEVVGNMGRHALYRFYSDNGELLYVGTSGDFGRRFPAHAQKIWFLQVRGITLEWYATEDGALKAERRAIHVEHPRYNVQHRDLKTLATPPPAPKRSNGRAAQRSGGVRVSNRTGLDVCISILERNPGLTNVQVAERAGVSTKTVTRARAVAASRK